MSSPRTSATTEAPVRVAQLALADRGVPPGPSPAESVIQSIATPSSCCTPLTASLTGLPPSSSAKVRVSSGLRCSTVEQASGSARSYTAISRRPVRCDSTARRSPGAGRELVAHADAWKLSLGYLGHPVSLPDCGKATKPCCPATRSRGNSGLEPIDEATHRLQRRYHPIGAALPAASWRGPRSNRCVSCHRRTAPCVGRRSILRIGIAPGCGNGHRTLARATGSTHILRREPATQRHWGPANRTLPHHWRCVVGGSGSGIDSPAQESPMVRSRPNRTLFGSVVRLSSGNLRSTRSRSRSRVASP